MARPPDGTRPHREDGRIGPDGRWEREPQEGGGTGTVGELALS
ncbi:hypothetical protein [Streptomyces sp. NPDC053720]